MRHVAQDHQKKRILQGSSGERQEKCDTNDHSGNRICHKRNALEYILHVLRQLAPVSYTHLDVYKRQRMDRSGCDRIGRRIDSVEDTGRF